MSSPIPDRLSAALAGRYRIERELGAGGMATVYLAFDEKHDRKVAIKVLKPELAAVLGAERFVVEIKTTAAMSHPHILPLFDSGTADGFLFYVMPYIEGETIREKLNRETQFGVDEAVRIAREVADALDYAHRHGVIHRDIKPENILLHDGRAMVMDFGIALAVSAAAGGRMTETGLSLGTPHYMSPEQATAEKEITARSDQYSLASVLYEMLAGQPPHIGGAAQQVIMRIITEPARPVSEFRKNVPENVVAALAKALEKLPADRFESAKVFADALGNATFATGAGRRVAAVRPGASSWRERATIPALALSILLAAVAAWALLKSPPAVPLSRYFVDFPVGKQLGATQWAPFAVSPDGSKLVYMGETGRLWLRSRDQLDPVELQGTEGAFNPFFSPDGKRIGFMSGAPGSAEIKTMPATGGPPATVTNKGVGGPGAAWGPDGYIYFDASGAGPLRRVRENGAGDPEDASVRDSASGELQHNWPDPLPNGRGVLIAVDRAGPGVNVSGDNDIAVVDLATKKHKLLAKGIVARYAVSGHLLFVTAKGTLMAAPFDQDRLELTGSPVALLEGINIRRGGGGIDFSISRSGTLWYSAGSLFKGQEIVWVSRSGEATPIESGGMVGDFGALALSPEGTRVAVSVVDAAGEQIWVKQLGVTKGTFSKITFEGVNSQPRWHPNGKEIVFNAQFLPTGSLRSVRADGANQSPTVLAPGVPGRTYSPRWSDDGRWLVFESLTPATGRDIQALHVGVDTAPTMLLNSRFAENFPSVSPDGKWLLYQASTTGAIESYVRPFPDVSKGVYQISTGAGIAPKWSRDGREIFYRQGSNLVTVPVLAGAQFVTGEPKVLFSMPTVVDWDVAPGGQRFIMIRDRQGSQGPRVVTVENFFEELKAKVPRR